MVKLTKAEIENLEILESVGSSRNLPAFWEDYGELDPRVISELRIHGLVERQRCVRYGGELGERKRTGYWITQSGRDALKKEA